MCAVKATPLADRLWRRVERSPEPNGCWIWTGCVVESGYGKLMDKASGRTLRTHRLAWELTYGPIPDGLYVLHNCPGGDNPLCCNPAHLFLGTQLDNLRDAVGKGRIPSGEMHRTHRHPESVARGERHYLARLADDQVRQIKARLTADQRRGMQAELARQFGVSLQVVNDIARGRTYRHIA